MYKIGEQGKVPPPPLDEDGNPIMDGDGSNMETSTTLIVEELMKKLEKLNAELKKAQGKGQGLQEV
jgi:hypothetical protein